MSKWVRVTATVASILLGLMFIAAGTPKLLGVQQFVDGFAQLGIPRWFLLFTGAVEVVSGVFLLIPRLAWIGALGVAATMVGATYIHLVVAPETASSAATTLCLLAIAAFVVYARRPGARNPTVAV